MKKILKKGVNVLFLVILLTFFCGCEQEVQKIKTERIVLNKKSLELKIGQVEKLNVEIFPSDATNKNIIWESNNTKVATIDSNGYVSGESEGEAIIVAKNGNIIDQCRVLVKSEKILIKKIKIKNSGVDVTNKTILLNVDDITELNVELTPSNVSNKKITWKSSNEQIVVVNNGTIQALKEGKATISAVANDGSKASAKTTVKVNKKVDIEFSLKGASTINLVVGDTYKDPGYIAKGNDNNNYSKYVKKVGNVDTTKAGTYIIYYELNYEDNVKKLERKIIVKNVNATGINVSNTSYDVCLGETLNIKASVEPSNATKKDLVWETASSSIATVSSGKVTPKKMGKTTITIWDIDKKVNKQVTVKVYDCYDLALFWGQSNMVGFAGNYSYEKTTDNSKSLKNIDSDIVSHNVSYSRVTVDIPSNVAFEYKALTNKLVDISTNPETFGETLYLKDGKLVSTAVSDVEAIATSRGTNMIPYFAKEYYSKTNHKIVIVHAARGGRRIDRFFPDSSTMLYKEITLKYQMAEKYIKDKGSYYKIRNKFYVVYQGESDANATYSSSYYTNYKKVHDALIDDLNMSFGAIVVLGVGTREVTDQYVLKVREAQKLLIKNYNTIIEGTDYVYAELSKGNKSILCPREPNNNLIHLNAAALSQVGRNVAASIAKSNKIK